MNEAAQKRILLISLDKWPHCCRYPKALNQAGFAVSTCALEKNPINLSEHIDQRFAIPQEVDNRNHLLSIVAQACLDSHADFIMPCDDPSVGLLAELYAKIQEAEDQNKQAIRELIAHSRGNPEYYPHSANKHLTVELATALGIRAPQQQLCGELAIAANFAQKYGYPVVLKSEFGTAGAQVKVCSDENELAEGFAQLSQRGSVILQQHIEGKPAMANAAAYDGRLLACSTFTKEECYPDFKGPSAVVQHMDHKAMKKAAQKFIEYIGYSGILSLDFMVDKRGKAFLIECNARPAPVSHLGPVTGIDLFKALHSALEGEKYKPEKFRPQTIALFPKELARDNTSTHLYNAYHDVPWDEPPLVGYFLSTVPRKQS